jgi:hypothetical protein
MEKLKETENLIGIFSCGDSYVTGNISTDFYEIWNNWLQSTHVFVQNIFDELNKNRWFRRNNDDGRGIFRTTL